MIRAHTLRTGQPPPLSMMWGWLLLLSACQDGSGARNPSDVPRGEQLARAHCQGCHRWTPPTALDQATWQQGVLPTMAYYLGVHDSRAAYDELFEPGAAGQRVRQARVFPDEARLSEDDWQAIVAYYTHRAPDRLAPTRTPIDTTQTVFAPTVPPFRLNKPLVSMLATYRDGLVVGDVKRDVSQLSFLNPQLEEQYPLLVPEAPVQLIPADDGFYLLCMGRMYPSDAAQGQLLRIRETTEADGRRHFRAAQVLESLQRPVQAVPVDLDGDQDDDWVVCEFGYRTGRFGWYERHGDAYRYHALQDEPGAIQVAVRDFTGDRQPDLLVLFAQGDERMVLYTHAGNGTFEAKTLLRFLPVAGSTSFELTDWNDDGHLDILYTAGDNADYSQIIKPYHGITLFLNDGQQRFREAFFLEQHGAYQAHAADYDGDGDRDIAAISFFPDYQHRPEEGFVFYQNDGQDRFTRLTFPQVTQGRWIRMLSYDYEQDGDEDILLGSFVGLPPQSDSSGLYERWLENDVATLLLKNTTVPN